MSSPVSVPTSTQEAGISFYVDPSTRTLTLNGPVGGGVFDIELYRGLNAPNGPVNLLTGIPAATGGYDWDTIGSLTVAVGGYTSRVLSGGGRYRLVLRLGSGHGHNANLS